MNVKICGVTRVQDARAAARAGADLIGLNFWPRSKRHVSVDRGAEVAAAAREINPEIQVVGVFVNQSPIEILHMVDVVDLDHVQLHGDESAAYLARLSELSLIRAVALAADQDVDAALDLAVDALLVDAPTRGYGGSGTLADWSLARALCERSAGRDVILAGGLDPDNVARAIAAVRPWGVDVASGVESSPGIKDESKMSRFITVAKEARV